VAIACWAVCLAVSRYVSLSSIVAAIAVAISVWALGDKALVVKLAITLMSVLVIWLHRANIKRLLNGTESRFGKKSGDNA